MRLNDDGKTVAAMDVLVPKVGELIGGSQREERLEVFAWPPMLFLRSHINSFCALLCVQPGRAAKDLDAIPPLVVLASTPQVITREAASCLQPEG